MNEEDAKYRIKYYDVVNIEHTCLIYLDSYTGTAPIEIQGSVFLDYGSAENNLDVIRSQGLRVELEANSDLTFEDLYLDEGEGLQEKSIKVEYKRDDVLYFSGWLNPEGWYEDYVNSDWIVSFDCIDGLGYLENLSFVESNGLPITGKITQSEALFKALARTGIEKFMHVSIGIYYTGLTAGVPILDYVNVIADRYIKDDGKTFMSCEDVILDILEPYGAILTSFADGWYIYKPNELYFNSNVIFNKYTLAGVAYQSVSIDFQNQIGSDIENYSIRHCNQNQKFTIAPSIGAYRISYKYGLLESLLENENLVSADGTTIDDWTIVSTTKLVTPFTLDVGGVRFKDIDDTPIATISLESEPVTISGVAQSKIDINYTNPFVIADLQFIYKIYISDAPSGGVYYYLQDNLEWGAVGVSNELTDLQIGLIVENTTFNTTIRTPSKPTAISGDGYLFVQIQCPIALSNIGNEFLDLNYVSITPAQADDSLIGEFHTFQRITKPSAQVKEIKEVATGDNTANLYKGTLYKNDALTATETWYRNGFTESKALLRIMGEETMRMNQNPTRVYSGDVFGYIGYLSVITIANITGKFMILEYSYDTKNNVVNLVMKQILGTTLDDETDDEFYKKTFDYGDTVKPTIRG